MAAPSLEEAGTDNAFQGDTLLATKLYIPPTRPKLVPRPRLVARLEEALTHQLTLIAAPAGFGKTTLLGEWVHRERGRDLPAAWLALDAGDNDPTRFWTYVIAALGRRWGGIGLSALDLLRAPQPVSMELVLTTLINDLLAVAGDLVLILDDYHLVENSLIQKSIGFLLEHLPPSLHLVLSSRIDPPLPLARLRARGQLVELRAADLRFTPEETALFLNHVMGLSLSAEGIARLEARTEGWIAGLQLAALALRAKLEAPTADPAESSTTVAEFIQSFGGSHRYVLDYLEEVFQQQPSAVQVFLLRTSILERLSGPLCDAIVGFGEGAAGFARGDGQNMLEWLERLNLFIVPLDNERRWYRYQQLFAGFLRARLLQSQPGLVPELHRRAASWYEQNGLAEEAINHALAAGDGAGAARLVEGVTTALVWKKGQVSSFLDWLGALPEEEVRVRPRLVLSHAWTLMLIGQLERAAARLQEAEAILSGGGASPGSIPEGAAPPAWAADIRSLQGELASTRALLSTFQGDMAQTIRLCHQALEDIPEGRPFLRSAILGSLAAAYTMTDAIPAAVEAFAESSRLGLLSGNYSAALISASFLGEAQVAQGRLRDAFQTYRRALQVAEERGVQSLPATGMVHAGLGALLLEWNDRDVAAEHLKRGIERCQQWAQMGTQPAGHFLMVGYIATARLMIAGGDISEALKTVQQAEELAYDYNLPHWFPRLISHQVRLELRQGNVENAVHWVEELGIQVDDPPSPLYEFEYATLARLLLVRGRLQADHTALEQALDLLRRLQQRAQAASRMGQALEYTMLRALSLQAKGELPQALACLEQALKLAGPEGYVRLFVDEGVLMQHLLHQVVARGQLTDYGLRLLAAFEAEPPSGEQPLVEPLSERELEVLRLLAAGLSNQEIAAELILALGTVKKHLNNIYGKLGVGSRTQAVARSRALGLLS